MDFMQLGFANWQIWANKKAVHLLCALLLIYIGYRIGGVIWMILAVPVGMVIINMCQAGAFDYIFDDMKTLIVGILKLRDEEQCS